MADGVLGIFLFKAAEDSTGFLSFFCFVSVMGLSYTAFIYPRLILVD
jgi:hypothetical protein